MEYKKMKTIVGKKLTLTVYKHGLCLETTKTGKQFKMFWVQWHKYFILQCKRVGAFVHLELGYLSVSMAW